MFYLLIFYFKLNILNGDIIIIERISIKIRRSNLLLNIEVFLNRRIKINKLDICVSNFKIYKNYKGDLLIDDSFRERNDCYESGIFAIDIDMIDIL